MVWNSVVSSQTKFIFREATYVLFVMATANITKQPHNSQTYSETCRYILNYNGDHFINIPKSTLNQFSPLTVIVNT